MRLLPALLAAFICFAAARAQTPSTAFEDRLTQANTLFTQDKLPEALAALQAAARAEPARFEAPALAALVLHKAGRAPEARQALADARKLAPVDRQARLDGIEKLLATPAPAPASTAAPAAPPSGGIESLTGAARRRYEALMLIIEEAEAASPIEARRKLLAEFLAKSADFVREQPALLPVWMLRATVALELNDPPAGHAAGQAVVKLAGEDSPDPKLRKLLVTLERRGWLGEKAPEPTRETGPKAGDAFVNSLGMKFVPVPGTEVLFGVWDVRVQDYEVFVRETGQAWKKAYFTQGPTHPAVNVSWDDAQAFCAWLSKKENQTYRLPRDWEWSVAVGLSESHGGTPADKDEKIKGVYPWGTQWPPPRGAGNYGGSLNVDDFSNTSPVGSFAANRFGLFDMGGNVWQWCEDFFDGSSGARVLRGAVPAFCCRPTAAATRPTLATTASVFVWWSGWVRPRAEVTAPLPSVL